MVEVVEERGDPARVTDQLVPVGRPVAEKVTKNCQLVEVVEITLTVPDS